MAKYNLGRVVPIFQGDYDPNVSYGVLDVVLFNGSSYVAKDDTLGNEPTDPNYWQLVASAGQGGGGVAVVDSELSTTSKNPVQNKVITLKINDLESIIVPEETVRQIVEGYSYQNKAQVDANIEGRGFETAAETDEKLKPYVKKTDIATINGQVITNGGNITIEGGGAAITVDSELSTSSENPVQNKVITTRINEVEGKIKPVPTKVSELTNDSDFQSASQVQDYVNGKGYQTAQEVETAITAKGYITDAAVEAKGYTTLNEVAQQGYAKVGDIPTKVSQLTNDEEFVKKSSIATVNNQSLTEGGNITIEGGAGVTVEQVNQIVDGKDLATNTRVNEVEGKIPTDNAGLTNGAGYAKMSEVEAKGYQTSTQVEGIVNGKGYQTSSQVQQIIDQNTAGYQTAGQVAAAITANPEGFAKTTDVDAKLSKKADSTRVDGIVATIPDTTEAWEFTLEDGSIITKNVYIQA